MDRANRMRSDHLLAAPSGLTPLTPTEYDGSPDPDASDLLGMLSATGAAIDGASTVEQVAKACFEGACAIIGWPVGHLYLSITNHPTQRLPIHLWKPDNSHNSHNSERFERFRRVTEAIYRPAETSLPEQVAANGEAVWLTDLTNELIFP